LSVDPSFKAYIDGLNIVQLRREIEIEEAAQTQRQLTLEQVQKNIEDIKQTIIDEKLLGIEDRLNRRRDRIEQLIKIIQNWNKEIDLVQDRITGYDRIINSIQRDIGIYERRSADPFVSFIDRDMARNLARILRRSIAAYRGHRTRQQNILTQLKRFKASSTSELGAQTRWMKTELPLEDRLNGLRRRLTFLKNQAKELTGAIQHEELRLEYKRSKLPPHRLERVHLNYYLIIEEGEHIYPRNGGYYVYRRGRTGVRRTRQRQKYPKGRFQAWLECDTFIDPDTGEIQQLEDPFITLDAVMRKTVVDLLLEVFSVPNIDLNDLTLGTVSETGKLTELGKPPYIDRVERTVDDGEDFGQNINRYVMTVTDYDQLTKNMAEYREALRRIK